MRQTERFSRQVFIRTILGSVAAAAAAGGGFWAMTAYLNARFATAVAGDPALLAGQAQAWIGQAAWIGGPSLAGLCLVIGLFQWRLVSRLGPVPAADRPASGPGPENEAARRQAAARREQRLFVHLFSRLQREGRLMDFLAEDLDGYDDVQIGAAVRSVHAGCRRTVDRLLAPRSVLAEPEEGRLTVAADYDTSAVTLTGRVTDHPPFEGIVRHSGWRAGRIEIPLLSDEADPAIIAPAQVEVL